MAQEWKPVPMLARTHGQPASPTRLGKEDLRVCGSAEQQMKLLSTVPFAAKFGGATGNFNAHHVAYPEIDWIAFGNRLVNEGLGLHRSRVDHPDRTLRPPGCLLRRRQADQHHPNGPVPGCVDLYFHGLFQTDNQKGRNRFFGHAPQGQPHRFRECRRQPGIANAVLEHLSAKLPISRLQRDLTDSTVTRNIGVPLGHTLIALKSLKRGLDKLILNEDALKKDLDSNWAVVAEGIQTVLRREGYPKPYEALLALTRTHAAIDQAAIVAFIDGLDVAESVKKELLAITPETLYRHRRLSEHAQTLPERIRARPCRREVFIACREGILRDHFQDIITDIKFLVRHGALTVLLHNIPNRFANQKLITNWSRRLPATGMVRISPEMDFYDAVLNHRKIHVQGHFSGTPISH
jgi:adenylosuccinate lyase